MKKFFTTKKIVISLFIIAVMAGILFLIFGFKNNTTTFAIKSLNILDKVSGLLLIEEDKQKEIHVLNQLVEAFTKKDDQTHTILLMLQNNMELRPGGGFLGQYAVVKVKNGEVLSTFVEDANLLDQRINAKITPPYPFTRMMQLKKWKFRDSNFSPDFPENVKKAEYFYRLAGGREQFDIIVAVNSDVLNHVLEITGPISVPGYPGTYTSQDAALKLEEFVEKRYIMDPELDTQNRKMILKSMANIIIDKLVSIGNITKIAELGHREMQNKNVMLYFKDPALQTLAESVHWDGKVSLDWSGDYLMAIDANMGALKTDYYMRREMSYDIDLTQPKPIVNLNILYKNTAPYGDWRTSDYHTYLRVYVPKGATLLEREMVSPPLTNEEFNKTYFGAIVHVLIGGETHARIKYELPETFDKDNYKLLIQKQSGVGDVPVKIHVKTKDGKEFNQEATLTKDLKFEFGEQK